MKQQKEVKKPKKINRRVLTEFIILCPSLIMGITNDIFVKAIVLIFQAILISQFVDKYYEFE